MSGVIDKMGDDKLLTVSRVRSDHGLQYYYYYHLFRTQGTCHKYKVKEKTWNIARN